MLFLPSEYFKDHEDLGELYKNAGEDEQKKQVIFQALQIRYSMSSYSTLKRILQILQQIQQKEITMAATLDDLINDVTANKQVTDSVVTLLNGIAAQLAAAIASGDPVKIQAVHDGLVANSTALANAVAANTPASAKK